jgi:hypothetical protein
MRETDRARQESAALQRQLEREKSEHARERATLSEELNVMTQRFLLRSRR